LQAVPNEGPQLVPAGSGQGATSLGSPTAGEPDASPKPRGRRWRKASTGAQAGEASNATQAQNAQPAGKQPPDADAPASAASAAAAPADALPADATTEPGKPLVLQAYAKSRTAKEESGFTETIDFCRDAMQAGVKPATATYVHQLMSWAHNRRGEIQAAAERDDQAFHDFDAAVELDSTSWRALHNRGVSYAVLGQSGKALADFNRAIELNPDFATAYFNRGETRYESGDFEAALADYDTAARLLPDDAGVFNSRGHAHFRMGHFTQAVADFNRTLKLDPKSAAAYLNRGDAYAAMGNYGAAAHDYDASIRIRPDLGRAHQSMAWLLATCPDPKFRNPAQAVVAAKIAIELDGQEDHRYLATLAAALANAGKFDAAERVQRQAVRGAPAKLRPTQEKRLALYHSHKPFRTGSQEAPRSTDREVRNVPATTGVRQVGGYTR
jgi:tetratricopeptide (TPR) repeat protein